MATRGAAAAGATAIKAEKPAASAVHVTYRTERQNRAALCFAVFMPPGGAEQGRGAGEQQETEKSS